MKTHMHLQTFILIFILALLQTASSTTYQQYLDTTPKSFGLYMVLDEQQDIGQFNKYLQNYATMECELISQIFVVAAGRSGRLEDSGILMEGQWRRSVVFWKKRSQEAQQLEQQRNSLYKLSHESKASLYFIMHNNIQTSCNQLAKTFVIWQKKATGDLGPLLSYKSSSYNFVIRKQIFEYADNEKSKYFTTAQPSGSWVSRFYLELINSDKIWEVNQIRQVVKKNRQCDGLALNFIVEYFFGEFVVGALGGNLTYKSTAMYGQNRKRSQCIKQFAEILGYNPMRIVNKGDNTSPQRYNSQSDSYIIYLKRLQLEQLMQQSMDLTTSMPGTESLLKSSLDSGQSSQIREQLSKLKINLYQVKLKHKQLTDKQSGVFPNPALSITKQKSTTKSTKTNAQQQQLNIKVNQILSMVVFVLTMVPIMLGYVVVSHCYTKCVETETQQKNSQQKSNQIKKRHNLPSNNKFQEDISSSSSQDN